MASKYSQIPRLVDSSVWIRADRRRNEAVRNRLVALIGGGLTSICWPIHAELLVGVGDERQRKSLDERLSALDHIPVGEQTWSHAAEIGWRLSRLSQSVPMLDLVIAAVAIESNLILWTVDTDFKRVAATAPLRLDLFGLEQYGVSGARSPH